MWWARIRLKWIAWKCRHSYSRRILTMPGLEIYAREAPAFHMIRLGPKIRWLQFGFLAFRIKIT
jgi:hypothetical protein